jgi:hypothetical protein
VVGFVVGELSGYYSTVQVGIVLAYMALCRIKCVGRLRYESQASWASCSGWTAFPKCAAYTRSSQRSAKAMPQNDGPDCCRVIGLREIPIWPECCTSMGTCGCITAINRAAARLRVAPTVMSSCHDDYWVNDGLGQLFS